MARPPEYELTAAHGYEFSRSTGISVGVETRWRRGARGEEGRPRIRVAHSRGGRSPSAVPVPLPLRPHKLALSGGGGSELSQVPVPRLARGIVVVVLAGFAAVYLLAGSLFAIVAFGLQLVYVFRSLRRFRRPWLLVVQAAVGYTATLVSGPPSNFSVSWAGRCC